MTGTRTAREQGSSWPSFSRIHNSLGRLGAVLRFYYARHVRVRIQKNVTKKQEYEKPTVRGLIMRNWTGRDCPPLATKPRYEPFLLSL